MVVIYWRVKFWLRRRDDVLEKLMTCHAKSTYHVSIKIITKIYVVILSFEALYIIT